MAVSSLFICSRVQGNGLIEVVTDAALVNSSNRGRRLQS